MTLASAILGVGTVLVVCATIIGIAMVEVARLRGLAVAVQALAEIEKAKVHAKCNADGESSR